MSRHNSPTGDRWMWVFMSERMNRFSSEWMKMRSISNQENENECLVDDVSLNAKETRLHPFKTF